MLPLPHNVARQRVGCSRFHPASTAFATTVSGLSLPALTVCFPGEWARGVKVRVEGNWTGLFGDVSRRARDWVACNERVIGQAFLGLGKGAGALSVRVGYG